MGDLDPSFWYFLGGIMGVNIILLIIILIRDYYSPPYRGYEEIRQDYLPHSSDWRNPTQLNFEKEESEEDSPEY